MSKTSRELAGLRSERALAERKLNAAFAGVIIRHWREKIAEIDKRIEALEQSS